jgi:hypothetical protein
MITPVQAQEISREIQSAGLSETVLPALRQKYQPIHFTYCLDDDIASAKPVIETNSFNLYLIDGREHCLCLTNDFDIATGIVIAEIIPD